MKEQDFGTVKGGGINIVLMGSSSEANLGKNGGNMLFPETSGFRLALEGMTDR
jgi:hypothetical protein